MKPILKPEILIASAATKFNEQGTLTDETGRDLIRKKLAALKELVLRIRMKEVSATCISKLKFFCSLIKNQIMADQRFEIVLDGVPYSVTASPFEYNTETRYKVRYNGNEHIFTWDSSLGRLVAIDDDAGIIPDSLEEAIAGKLQFSKKI